MPADQRQREWGSAFFAWVSPFRIGVGSAKQAMGREPGSVVGVTDPDAPATAIPDAMRTSPKAGALWGGVWLFYLAPAIADAVSHRHPLGERIAGVALLLTFAFLYIATLLYGWDRYVQGDDDPYVDRWLAPMTPIGARLTIALVVCATASTAIVGNEGVAAFVFMAPIAATVLPGPQARWGILAAVAAVTVGQLVAPHSGHAKPDASDILSTAFSTLMAGAITLGVRRMRTVMWELHRARMDARRLATAEERVRIARDLHDVLGHSLTVISMRSQLAARLSDRGEIERATEEIKAVEELSRSAMKDVREAVAGYRVRPFAAELAAAEATLGGAGLVVNVDRSDEELPAAGEEALAFVMREGVTNVLRHSSAGRCAISVRHTPSAVIVELADDGRGVGTPLHALAARGDGDEPGNATGNGLRGLAERLAAVGGTLSAGDAPAGGFVLRAEVAR